jgi:rhodanese-related sulfurtransferase
MAMYSSDNRKPTCCSRRDLSAYKVETAEDRNTIDPKSKPPKKNIVTDKRRHLGFAMTLAVSVLMASVLFAGDQGVKPSPAQMSATSPCDTPHQVPKSNTTSLGLYVSPREAYDMWKAGPDAVILVMCSTGGRAAMAVNQLAKAGFVNVYNIVNGLEGEIVEDPKSAYFGKHMKNGWKNCGLPWTYSFNPDLMWVSPDE